MSSESTSTIVYTTPGCPFCAAAASEYSGDSQDVPGYFGVHCTD
ncbi:hypothetical protein LCGC14_3160730, partial [marine sediment metagenome]